VPCRMKTDAHVVERELVSVLDCFNTNVGAKPATKQRLA
jgi:hypothetical protein